MNNIQMKYLFLMINWIYIKSFRLKIIIQIRLYTKNNNLNQKLELFK